jgi:hypothetical protein
MQVSVQASREQVDRLRRLLMEWIAECEALADEPESDEDTVKAAGLVTFYER